MGNYEKWSKRVEGENHIYGPEGQGFESLIACQHKTVDLKKIGGFWYFMRNLNLETFGKAHKKRTRSAQL